jgi:hypothetical protein
MQWHVAVCTLVDASRIDRPERGRVAERQHSDGVPGNSVVEARDKQFVEVRARASPAALDLGLPGACRLRAHFTARAEVPVEVERASARLLTRYLPRLFLSKPFRQPKGRARSRS